MKMCIKLGEQSVGVALQNHSGLGFYGYERHVRLSEVDHEAYILRLQASNVSLISAQPFDQTLVRPVANFSDYSKIQYNGPRSQNIHISEQQMFRTEFIDK